MRLELFHGKYRRNQYHKGIDFPLYLRKMVFNQNGNKEII